MKPWVLLPQRQSQKWEFGITGARKTTTTRPVVIGTAPAVLTGGVRGSLGDQRQIIPSSERKITAEDVEDLTLGRKVALKFHSPFSFSNITPEN